MDKKQFDIQDDDFRVIGRKTEPETPVTKRRLWRPLLVVLLIIAAIAALLLLVRTEPQASDNASSETNEPEAVVFEPMAKRRFRRSLQTQSNHWETTPIQLSKSLILSILETQSTTFQSTSTSRTMQHLSSQLAFRTSMTKA